MATRIREWNYGRKQPKITKKWLNSTVFILNHETHSFLYDKPSEKTLWKWKHSIFIDGPRII